MEQRGRLNIGQLVRQHEGRSETALIGMGTYRGTVIAAESWNAPMEEMTVPPAQDGSYEHVFDRAGGHDQFLVTDDLDDDAALGQPVGIALSASCTIPTANPETTCRPSFPIATTRSSTSTKRVRSIRSPSTPTERTSRTSIRGDCDPIGPDFARDSAADREESRCRHRIELPVSRWSVAVAEQDGDFAPWTIKNSSRPFADGRTSSRTSRPNGDNGNAPDVLLSHPFCNGGYAVGSSGRYDICRGDFFDDFHCFKPETAQAPYKFIPFNYTTNWHDWPRVSFPVFTRRDIIHPRGWVQSPRPIGRGLPQSIGCARTGYYLIGRRTGLHDTRCLRLRDAVPVRSVGPPRPGGRRRERDRGLLEQGLRDEIDFATSLRQRVSLLEGMPADQVETAFERCQLRDGAAELIADLRRSDVSVAIITGSFERGVETALERADIAVDHLVANRLVLEKRGTDRRSRRSAARGRKGPSPRRARRR